MDKNTACSMIKCTSQTLKLQTLDLHLADAGGVGGAALPRPRDDHVQHLQQQVLSPLH
jgi:hypothetical protein